MMITINGRKYKINMDMKWGTQRLLKQIQDDPQNVDNLEHMETILKDILKPKPTKKEIYNFRNSHIEKIFNEFNTTTNDTNADFKKKRSQ